MGLSPGRSSDLVPWLLRCSPLRTLPSVLRPPIFVLRSLSSVLRPPSSDGGARLRRAIPDERLDREKATVQVGLLTAGRDRPYAIGLASALIGQGIFVDYVGSISVFAPELDHQPLLNFLNMRDQREDAGALGKMLRVLGYYWRLMVYAATARPKILHILWNNKFEYLDRTLLMLYYKLLRKKLVFTVHNVNAGQRDGNDSVLNRWTLRIQYQATDHLFVHTSMMKTELIRDFGIPEGRVTVIPFGINNTVPNTALTGEQARRRLGLAGDEKVLLFFGNIAPYKGLEYLVEALAKVAKRSGNYRVIIAGKPKGCDDYWAAIKQQIAREGIQERIIERIEYVPDAETEVYFKAADILVLPYTHVFQSGVLFLAYSFGLPVIASDVGINEG